MDGREPLAHKKTLEGLHLNLKVLSIIKGPNAGKVDDKQPRFAREEEKRSRDEADFEW